MKKRIRTDLDRATLARLDTFCLRIDRTPADVVRGLLYALLIDGKQYIFEDWRDVAKPHKAAIAPPAKATLPMTAQQKIRRAMERGQPRKLGELKNSTASKHFTPDQWDKALQGLAESGEIQIIFKRTLNGRTSKVVVPVRVDAA